MARRMSSDRRRLTQWGGIAAEDGAADTLPVMVTLAAGTPAFLSQGVDTTLNSTTNQFEERVTLTRTIANIVAHMNVVTASSRATVAIGCLVVTAEALAAGVGSIKSPEDDPDADWVFYSVFQLRNPVASTLEGGAAPDSYREHVDVRSQRKILVGQTLIWIAEAELSDVSVGVGGRYLLKLA